jgi:ketosteroid isomerase-like protein
MNQVDSAIVRMLDTYKAAVYAKDVDAFVDLYDDEVCIFDMWGAWTHDGVAAWRKTVADWFGSLGTERVVVDLNVVRTIAAPELVMLYAFVTYQAISAEGTPLRAMQNRLTWALTRADGACKIVHEHTSAPLDFVTSKVILQRD